MNDIDSTMKELAEYTRMAEEIAATVDSLKDVLKSHMDKIGVDTIAGAEHKATYKAVSSSRIDTTALKRDKPDIAAQYTKTINSKRFIFV